MSNKNQSKRLTVQHKKSKGVINIFSDDAKILDKKIIDISQLVIKQLEEEYPNLIFRHRKHIKKEEINRVLNKISPELGQTLFVKNANIKPDGGIIEVKDSKGNWRIILISETKYQGKDIENIKLGKLVGKDNDKNLMVAGNAIERSFKNIFELSNLMILEKHFPYILFLSGFNFLTEKISIKKPNGEIVILKPNNGGLNRLDRLTSANYGMPINTNLCENKYLDPINKTNMIRSTSIYTKGNGEKWTTKEMFDIMIDISKTSLRILKNEI